MKIGVVGDVHGRVFHAIAAVASWQEILGERFDLLLQVGDMGAYPDPARLDEASQRYLAVDPSEADFRQLLKPTADQARKLGALRGQLSSPIYFVRGNHEDLAWLDQLPVDRSRTAAVDAFDLFRYVPDGTILDFSGTHVAFLGGVEFFSDERGLNPNAYQSLMDAGPGRIDILVTHEGPYGMSRGHHGDIQGSKQIAALVEHTRPSYHLAGHTELIGPRELGSTLYLNLNDLVPSPLWQPEATGLEVGCMAYLDTEERRIEPVRGDWLESFPRPFDFDSWSDSFLAEHRAEQR